MPDYSVPRIYLGNDEEAKTLYEEIEQIKGLNPKRFSSKNRFLLHCLTYTLKHDKNLVRPRRKDDKRAA